MKFLGYSDGDAAKDPILYQHLTQLLLERRVKEHYPVAEEQSKQKKTLDFEEANSVRYIAGYVLRALKKKLLRMSNPLQKELDLCLSEMLEDGQNSGSSSEEESEKWTNSIDRGDQIMLQMQYTHFLFQWKWKLGSIWTREVKNVE